jgi:hypothetical protein
MESRNDHSRRRVATGWVGGLLVAVAAAAWAAAFLPALDKPLSPAAAQAGTWPRPIPARSRDGANPELFVMILGEVETPLADGIFDPLRDELKRKDGTVIPHYYRDVLGVKYFRPIDKTLFPLPPSGLCTWYYYYQDIDENEVKLNAEWIAGNLRDYGARYVQIDDGWQGETSEGRHGSRDWTTVDKAFPHGMASLAATIRSLGLVPGIWIAPHGQSNEAVVKKNRGVFMLKPDGASASETWEGKYLIDPSAPAAIRYLKELFATMVGWGYDYFKIDGQPIVVDEYKSKAKFMKKPTAGEAAYRKTIAAIRSVIGPSRFLLGCWGLPLEGMGFMDGSRTGGDVVLGWEGFFTALWPTMQSYFMHNIAWYTDPDVMLLRPPLTLDQARVWATLQGLTGQALFASDRLPDLSAERVELLRRVFPAADIRPLDLFPSPRNKRIWDLKISHLGRGYDVVGAFNFDSGKSDSIYVNWQELGIAGNGPVHVFDFWNHEYLGAWEAGLAVELAPTSCRVLTLMPDDGGIQLLSTSRHITQGWVDLVRVERGPDSFRGASRLIRDDPYELHFAFPRGKNFVIAAATARGADGPLPVKISNHQGWSTVRIDSAKTIEAEWQVTFAPAAAYRYPTREPSGLRVQASGLDGVDLQWNAQYYLNAGYQVYLDGRLLGYTGSTSFPLRRLDPGRAYTAEVRSVWDDATIGPRHKKAELAFSVRSALADEVALARLEPVGGAGPFAGFGDSSARLNGKRYDEAIVALDNADIAYELHGLYGAFTALAGVDERSRQKGPVTFIVTGDGRELWNSGTVEPSSAPRPVRVDVSGVKRLVLRVNAANAAPLDPEAEGFFGPHGVWALPRLTGLTNQQSN